MAKVKRKLKSVDSHFWDDSYIDELNPFEKLLFLYLLTNQNQNLAGIYEISLKKITYQTGLERNEVTKILEKFSDDRKVYFVDGYIIMLNYSKHQNYNATTMAINIKHILEDLPEKIIDFIISLENKRIMKLFEISKYPINVKSYPIPYPMAQREVEREGEKEVEGEDEVEGNIDNNDFQKSPKGEKLDFTNEGVLNDALRDLYLVFWSWGEGKVHFASLDKLRLLIINDERFKPSTIWENVIIPTFSSLVDSPKHQNIRYLSKTIEGKKNDLYTKLLTAQSKKSSGNNKIESTRKVSVKIENRGFTYKGNRYSDPDLLDFDGGSVLVPEWVKFVDRIPVYTIEKEFLVFASVETVANSPPVKNGNSQNQMKSLTKSFKMEKI